MQYIDPLKSVMDKRYKNYESLTNEIDKQVKILRDEGAGLDPIPNPPGIMSELTQLKYIRDYYCICGLQKNGMIILRYVYRLNNITYSGDIAKHSKFVLGS